MSGFRNPTFIIHRSITHHSIKDKIMSRLHNESPKKSFSGRHAQDRHPADHRRPPRRRARIAGRADHEHGPIVAKLLSSTLRHANGLPVECVIADCTIGGVAEAAACAEKFRKEGVGVSLTVTPCWCYGAETMDMDPLMPKAVWGFNGTERPGAVYLAAVLRRPQPKGPAGLRHLRPRRAGRRRHGIPADVAEKLLQFARAGLAVATMRGKSYLSIGGTSMGIAGSIVDHRCSSIPRHARRGRGHDRDHPPHRRTASTTRTNSSGPWPGQGILPRGQGLQPARKAAQPGEEGRSWETSVKMALIIRDMMVGNPRLAELGFGEEALGHNAIAAGFQGQRQWTDHFPNGDFMEAILNTSFDWNGIRQPYILATENDALNGASMLFGHLLTGTAQIFADVRTYWSPDGRQARHRPRADRRCGRRHSPPDQLRPGRAGRHRPARERRQARHETVLGDHRRRGQKCLEATSWHTATWSISAAAAGRRVPDARRHAGHDDPPQHGQGPGPGPADRRRLDGRTAAEVTRARRAHQPDLADHLVRARLTGSGAFSDVYTVMANWGANHGAFSYGHIGADLITLASMLRIPVYMHNVPETRDLPPQRLDRLRHHRPRRRRLPRLRKFRAVVREILT